MNIIFWPANTKILNIATTVIKSKRLIKPIHDTNLKMGKKRSRELEGKDAPVEDPTVDKMDEDGDDDDEVGNFGSGFSHLVHISFH